VNSYSLEGLGFASYTFGIASQRHKTEIDKPRNRQFAAYIVHAPFSVAARSSSWVCVSSLAGIGGSISAGVMDVCLL